MRIAVIADTHGKFPASAASRLRKADEIWHLGDYCDQQTLDAIKAVVVGGFPHRSFMS